MASAFVQKRDVYSGAQSLAYNSNNAAGNFLVAWIVWNTGALTGVSDTANGAWTVSSTFQRTASLGAIAYKWNCAAGANTVSCAGTLGDIGFTIFEFSGVQTSSDPLDGSITKTDISTPTTTPTSASFNTSATGLIIAGIADEGTGQGSATAAGAGYSIGGDQISHYHADEYQVAVASGSHTASFTCSNNGGNDQMIVIAAFKDAGAGGGGGANGSHALRYWYRSQVSETL